MNECNEVKQEMKMLKQISKGIDDKQTEKQWLKAVASKLGEGGILTTTLPNGEPVIIHKTTIEKYLEVA